MPLLILTHLLCSFITLFALSIATASDEKEGNPVSNVVVEDKDAPGVDIEVQVAPGWIEKKGTEISVLPATPATLLFQVILMLVSCHHSIVQSSRGISVVNSDMSKFFAENRSSFWIKLCVQWLSFLL